MLAACLGTFRCLGNCNFMRTWIEAVCARDASYIFFVLLSLFGIGERARNQCIDDIVHANQFSSSNCGNTILKQLPIELISIKSIGDSGLTVGTARFKFISRRVHECGPFLFRCKVKQNSRSVINIKINSATVD